MGNVRHESSPLGDDLLARRFLAREPRMVESVARLAARVVRFHGYSIPRESRDDVVQDVVVQVWQALTKSGADYAESLEALVRSVAYRRCIDWMRRRRATVPLDERTRSASPGPEAEVLADERRTLARKVIERLGSSCQELIRLHAEENRTYREIALLLGRREGALRTQMSACLKKAREILGSMRRRDRMLRGSAGRA
jgi:RNA polymerase sigma factor (sigma-70 family)